MVRRVGLSIVFALLAPATLPACGAAQQHVERAQRRDGGVGLKKIGEFDHPTYVSAAPGFPMLLFVVEQPGRVEVLRGGRRLRHPFLDIRALVGYDGGEIASGGLADHVVITRSQHIPRIQEAQASAYHVLRELVR